MLVWKWKTDAYVELTVTSSSGTPLAGGTGTYQVRDRSGTSDLLSAALTDQGDGTYRAALPSDLAGVAEGSRLRLTADVTVGALDAYTEVDIAVRTDRA